MEQHPDTIALGDDHRRRGRTLLGVERCGESSAHSRIQGTQEAAGGTDGGNLAGPKWKAAFWCIFQLGMLVVFKPRDRLLHGLDSVRLVDELMNLSEGIRLDCYDWRRVLLDFSRWTWVCARLDQSGRRI